MKKQDNFVKEVVSFLKKLLVSRKQEKIQNSRYILEILRIISLMLYL